MLKGYRVSIAPEVIIKSLSDQQLVEQAKLGNSQAYGEIYTRHRHTVFDYSLRLVKEDEAAKDIVHETFLRMHSSLDGMRNGVVLRVWLLSIARNIAFNFLRKNKLVQPLIEELESDDESPFEIMVRDERERTVRHLIESLSPGLRELIVLREYEELSYREIAAVTGLSEDNVKVRIYRARKAIASELIKDMKEGLL